MKSGAPFNPYKVLRVNLLVPEQLLDVEGPQSLPEKERLLSFEEMILYGLLRKMAGADGLAYPAVETLAERMRRTDRTVRTWLRRLEDFGLIRRVRGGGIRPRDGRGSATNLYEFLWHAAFERDKQGASTGSPLPVEKASTGKNERVQPEKQRTFNRKPASDKEVPEKVPEKVPNQQQRKKLAELGPSKAGTAAAGSSILDEILAAVREVFPTAKRGQKWEAELDGIDAELLPKVARTIREHPSQSAKTPVVLVREAVAEVQHGRREKPGGLAETMRRLEEAGRLSIPDEGEILATIGKAAKLAAKGDHASLEILRDYATGKRGERVTAAAAAALEGLDAGDAAA